MRHLFSLSILILLVAYCSLMGATIQVPTDQPTIQAGILAASDGDTVLVSPGTYRENIDYSGHSVFVKSLSGASVTIIEPASKDLMTIKAVNGEDAPAGLSGFTVRNGGRNSTVYQDCNHFVITGNVFRDNIPDVINPLTVIRAAGPCDITYNTFYGNKGINAVFSSDSCRIVNNTFDHNARGIYSISPLTVAVNNIVTNCKDYAINGSFAELDYNDVWPAGTATVTGPHGFSSDPRYLDLSANDYRLSVYSPCIEGGSPDPQYADMIGRLPDIGAAKYSDTYSPPFAVRFNAGNLDLTHTVTTMPTFNWHFYDPGYVQTTYEIELGTDNDWSVAESWTSGQIYSSDTSADYIGTDLTEGTTYYLRIRLQDSAGLGPWINHAFHINAPPPAPAVLYPLAGSSVSPLSTVLAVDNVADPEGDSVRYLFEIYEDLPLTNLAYSAYGIKAGIPYTRSPVCSLLVAGRDYWWTCRATDGYDTSVATAPTLIHTHSSPGKVTVPGDFSLLQAAVYNSSTDDTIEVAPGTYQEPVVFDRKFVNFRSSGGSGVTFLESASNDTNIITIIGGRGNLPVIDGFTLSAKNRVRGIRAAGGGLVINCDIGGASVADGAGIYLASSGVTVRNCQIHDNTASKSGGGVYLVGGTVENCRIFNNSATMGSGVNIYGSATITRNLIYSNLGDTNFAAGVCITSGCSSCNVQLVKNTIANNSRGLVVRAFEIGSISGNIIAFNDHYGYWDSSPYHDAYPRYNDFYGNGSGDTSRDWHGITVDPLFVDTVGHDYSLQIASPCIDAGGPDTLVYDPDGTPPDIGAIPYQFSQPVPIRINTGIDHIRHVISSEPTFFWSVADSLHRSQTNFEIEVGSSAYPPVFDLWKTGPVMSDSMSVVFGAFGASAPLSDGQTYRFRLRVGVSDAVGDWHYGLFSTNSPPGIPAPISPLSGSTINFSSVSLIVDTAANYDFDTISYFFEIYEDTANDTPLVQTYSVPMPGVSPAYSLPVRNLQADHLYFWRARAWDSFEYSEWCPFQSFQTRSGGIRLAVPLQYPTIQDAIDAASSSDTIVISPGTYAGPGNRDLGFRWKGNITLYAPAGPNATILDAEGTSAEPHRIVSLGNYRESNLTFEGLSFVHGHASQGGAVKGYQNGSPLNFINCTFRDNHAVQGGAISSWTLNLTRCLFSNNEAEGEGGALFGTVNGGHVDDCRFIGNSADLGGAVSYVEQLIFSNCEFNNNSADYGSGVYLSRGSFTLNNCLIVNNKGPVFYLEAAGGAFNYCTMVNNSSNVIVVVDAGAVLNNCVSAFNAGAAAVCERPFPDYPWIGTATASNCCFFGNGNTYGDCITSQTDTNGNFSQNPLFCNQTDDFRLQYDSPCATASSDGGPIGYGSVGCQTIDVGDDNPPLAYTFDLIQNYPNPFNPTTTINYSLARASNVRLTVYNLLGQIVITLVNERQSAGNHSVAWNSTDRAGHPVASGVYFYRITAGDFVASKKMMLLK